MASILIRNLDDETKDRLRMLAARNRRPLEAEVREILRYSVRGVAGLSPEPVPLPAPEREATVPANQAFRAAPDTDDPSLSEVRARFADLNRQFEELGLTPVELPEILQSTGPHVK